MKYTVPYTNVGKGGLLHINGKHYHTPSWTEVTAETTLDDIIVCLLYTSPSPRDRQKSRMPSSA